MKRFLTATMLLISSALFADVWEVSQVKIKHVQAGVDGVFYITVDGDIPETVGCTQKWGQKNWVGFVIRSGNESQKAIMSMALAAQINNAFVDIGGYEKECIDGRYPSRKTRLYSSRAIIVKKESLKEFAVIFFDYS